MNLHIPFWFGNTPFQVLTTPYHVSLVRQKKQTYIFRKNRTKSEQKTIKRRFPINWKPLYISNKNTPIYLNLTVAIDQLSGHENRTRRNPSPYFLRFTWLKYRLCTSYHHQSSLPDCKSVPFPLCHLASDRHHTWYNRLCRVLHLHYQK